VKGHSVTTAVRPLIANIDLHARTNGHGVATLKRTRAVNVGQTAQVLVPGASVDTVHQVLIRAHGPVPVARVGRPVATGTKRSIVVPANRAARRTRRPIAASATTAGQVAATVTTVAVLRAENLLALAASKASVALAGTVGQVASTTAVAVVGAQDVLADVTRIATTALAGTGIRVACPVTRANGTVVSLHQHARRRLALHALALRTVVLGVARAETRDVVAGTLAVAVAVA